MNLFLPPQYRKAQIVIRTQYEKEDFLADLMFAVMICGIPCCIREIGVFGTANSR
jgi:hypothetical protein